MGTSRRKDRLCWDPSPRLQKMDSGLFAAWSTTSTRALTSPRKTGMTLIEGFGQQAAPVIPHGLSLESPPARPNPVGDIRSGSFQSNSPPSYTSPAKRHSGFFATLVTVAAYRTPTTRKIPESRWGRSGERTSTAGVPPRSPSWNIPTRPHRVGTVSPPPDFKIRGIFVVFCPNPSWRLRDTEIGNSFRHRSSPRIESASRP